MTGTEALRRVEWLKRHGWTEPEIAAALALRSTTTFSKWDKFSPRAGTAAALRKLKAKKIGGAK